MPEREDSIRRLRNMFDEADASSDEEQAARLGVSVAEYRRGKDIGMWKTGERGPRYTGNAQFPVLKGQTLQLSRPSSGLRRQSSRPGFQNDT